MAGIDRSPRDIEIQSVDESQPSDKYDVGIVGAGPAGLTLAYVGHNEI